MGSMVRQSPGSYPDFKGDAMKDDEKTREQLVHELTELRSHNAALEKSITGSISAELAAEEASRYAESIVETVREALLVLDASLKIVSANRYFYRTFKVTPGKTIGSFIYDLGNKQWDIPRLRELLEEVLPEKQAFDDFEVDHNFQDIGHKIMLLNARQIYRKDIGAKMILLAIEDITERREIENGLEKARKELAATKISEDEAREYAESIINTVREPLIVLDHDLRVVTASRSFYEVFKVKPEETVEQLIYDLGNKQWDIPKLRELLETILPQKTTFDNYEVEHNFSTIGRRIMLLNARQIKRVFGKERIILLAIEDITERRRLESLLIDSEEQYRRLFETASDGIVLLEKREGKITHANPATEKMLGYTQKESIGNKLQDIGVLLDTSDFQTTMQNLNKSGILNYRNVKVETKSGQHIDTEIYLVDRAKLAQCNIRDITERKWAQEALKKNQHLLAETERIGKVGGWEFNIDTEKQIWTEEIYRIHEVDLTFDPTVEKGVNFYTPASRPIIERAVQRTLEHGEPFDVELEIITAKGNLRSVHAIGRADLEHRRVYGFFQDITERKQAEEALRKSERELKSKAENLEEVNTALNVLLRRLEERRIELEEKILSNIRERVLPFIDSLKKTQLSDHQASYLIVIETNLDNIASSFLHHLKIKYLNLTHREVQIASLVKEGKSTKEIAELLSIAIKTVVFHRNSLRNKLGLKNQKANLRAHLLTLT
jgi:PAS domain S-box-containing protein